MNTTRKLAPADLGLLLMRAMIGVVFVFHGGQKLFGLFGGYGLEATAGWMDSVGIPFPMLSATLAGSGNLIAAHILTAEVAASLAGSGNLAAANILTAEVSAPTARSRMCTV